MRRGSASVAAIAGALVLLACGESPEAAAPSSPASPEPPIAESVSAPPSTDVPAPPERAPGDAPTSVPATGCERGAWRDLGPGEWADVVAFEDGFVVARLAMEAGAERLTLSTWAGGAVRRLAETRLDLAAGARRTSGPTLATDGEHVMVAYVDGGARLRVATLTGRRLTPRTVAEGASLRFRPALTVVEGGWAVAWTNAHDTPMRVLSRWLAADGQARGEARDHTPVAGGAAAPTMVAGADTPRLVFLDPRRATSVCLRADAADGGFSEATVARPVGLVTEPPEIAAVRLGQADWLAYTGIGGLATTAVGWLSLAGTDDPSLLVPGTGYGTLHVDADRLGEGAVVVADTPTAAPPASPRQLLVHRVSADGELGTPLTLTGPTDVAERGRIAGHPDGRQAAVAFHASAHTWLAPLRCGVR